MVNKIQTVLVIGSRSITDYETVKKILNRNVNKNKTDMVIHGGANGVDQLVQR